MKFKNLIITTVFSFVALCSISSNRKSALKTDAAEMNYYVGVYNSSISAFEYTQMIPVSENNGVKEYCAESISVKQYDNVRLGTSTGGSIMDFVIECDSESTEYIKCDTRRDDCYMLVTGTFDFHYFTGKSGEYWHLDLAEPLHEHGNFVVQDEGNSITITCGNEGCSDPAFTATGYIEAEDKVYDGTVVTYRHDYGDLAEALGVTPVSKFVDEDDQTLPGAPKDAGKYKYVVTLGDYELVDEFEIKKVKPVYQNTKFTKVDQFSANKEYVIVFNNTSMGADKDKNVIMCNDFTINGDELTRTSDTLLTFSTGTSKNGSYFLRPYFKNNFNYYLRINETKGAFIDYGVENYYQISQGQLYCATSNCVLCNDLSGIKDREESPNKAVVTIYESEAAPTYYKLPDAPTGNEGAKLSTFTLTGGSVTGFQGHFEWKNPDTVVTLRDSDKTQFELVFVPNDLVNYEPFYSSSTVHINHTHANPTLVEGKDPTCTEDGWSDYYECGCGSYFEDEACEHPIEDLEAWKNGEGKIAATGHNYVDGECTNCHDKLPSENTETGKGCGGSLIASSILVSLGSAIGVVLLRKKKDN